MQLDNTIRQLRKQKELTQEALAGHMGVSVQAVSKWECGQSCPDIALLPRLAAFLGVTVDSLLSDAQELQMVREAQEMPVPETVALPPNDNGCPSAPAAPVWPDDGVLRVVQYRGHRLLRYDENHPGTVIALELPSHASQLTIEVHGSAALEGDVYGNLYAGTYATVGDINGSVYAGTYVECGDVDGGITAGTNVECGDVSGGASAGEKLTCGDVGGGVTAGTYIECGDVAGDASAGAQLTCGDVGGEVNAGAHVECGDVGGDANANAHVCCGDVGCNVNANAHIVCRDIGRDAHADGNICCGDVGGSIRAGGDVHCG